MYEAIMYVYKVLFCYDVKTIICMKSYFIIMQKPLCVIMCVDTLISCMSFPSKCKYLFVIMHSYF